MKYFFSIILFLSPIVVCAQLNIDTSKVKWNKTIDSINICWFDSIAGVPPLTKSTNPIEIRMISICPMWVIGDDCRVLSYDGKEWNAYIVNQKGYDSVTRTIRTIRYNLKPEKTYQKIFDQLNALGLFNVKSQYELEHWNETIDGVSYFIVYKIDNKFRCIHFENPDFYEKQYPKIKEYKTYNDIVKVLTKKLYKNPLPNE